MDVCTLCHTERCTLRAVVAPRSHLPPPNATHRTALCVPNVARRPLERVLPLQTTKRVAVLERNVHPTLPCDAATQFVDTRSLHGGFRSSAVARPLLELCFEAQPERQLLHVVAHGAPTEVAREALKGSLCLVRCRVRRCAGRRVWLELCCCVITRDGCGKQCYLCCTCLCDDNQERRKCEETFVRTMLFLLCVALPWQIRAR